MRKFLYGLYSKLERIIHPTLRYSQRHYYETLKKRIPGSCDRWLELGCGHQMFASWMTTEERELAARSRRLVGLDQDLPALKKNPVITDRIFGNGESLPFAAETFDLVTANMVVEHLEKPGLVLSEIDRVLRPGGLFLFHTPNSRCAMMLLLRAMPQGLKNVLAGVLEGRKEEDVFRTYYRMNTPDAISTHAEKAGFEIREIRLVSTNAVTALTPFCVVELLYLRLLERPAFANARSNLIVTLRKRIH